MRIIEARNRITEDEGIIYRNDDLLTRKMEIKFPTFDSIE